MSYDSFFFIYSSDFANVYICLPAKSVLVSVRHHKKSWFPISYSSVC